ncbi:hypothetical protein HXX76_012567 [Chlamydomonas incerta]|uniref:Small nuclear ribonucleoprotein Prp3 C-terminal domain-containing protein n=1 Tax=Chlamydomonas incerta TaxID=51695 RepID=A0A835SK65_CHLIN|nr:hypothetical protein HXX76_012567 [Chlamydomonas incerta]|eukprot:KAG2427051.1 hypothetical protein HXX76_012567 [Chlamydomonas incerta]
MDALQRQVEELEALRAVYPREGAEGLVLSEEQEGALLLAREVVEAAGAGYDSAWAAPPHGGPDLDALPLLSGTVRPPDLLWDGQPVALRFLLPRSYPLSAPPATGYGQTPGASPGSCVSGSGAPRGEGGRAVEAEAAEADRLMPHCAQLAVECSAPRHVHEALSGAVRAVAEREAAAGGGECLLLALETLREAVAAAEVESAAADDGGCLGEPASAGQPGCMRSSSSAAAVVDGSYSSGSEAGSCGLLCVLVWLHHLKSLTKRKLIVQWARELSLAGAVKPGFPGVVVVEGCEPDVREFLARMRSLSWQALQVRGEDHRPLPPAAAASTASGGRAASGVTRPPGPADAGALQVSEASRRLRGPLIELEESGMGQLGEMCREAGLHHVFLTALKL